MQFFKAEIINIKAIPPYRDMILGQNFIKISHVVQKLLESKHTDMTYHMPGLIYNKIMLKMYSGLVVLN